MGIFFVFTASTFRNYTVYERPGNGPTIVFLHGLAGNAANGNFLLNAFPNHRLVIPDLPGHGKSKVQGKTDIYEIALELDLLFNYYNVLQPTIIGHSLGGQLAILFEIVKPGIAKSLHLIAPAGLELFNSFQKQMILSSWQLGSYFQNMLAPISGSEYFDGSKPMPDSEIIASYMASMMDRPVKELLNRVQCPAFILFGEHDPLIPNKLYTLEQPVKFALKAVKDLANFQVSGIPAAGHWPMFENPAKLIQLLQSQIG